ncbi:TRAP transporter small permease [Ammoniphilus resinae]|uniref:TRAP-type C4-dicarboxylate transport system permease small subunit n=1 Tax=Ammoniphilus resinae TaxID=861532 RepID=A0ABS4GWR5_9BACL|nr:TRAP transporter small permease [Ammoniphilus resinae]MBP1934709.1 TRAP-type C4-dicarboxylate transport system permease small subunit [Ammoniphilus resinae]
MKSEIPLSTEPQPLKKHSAFAGYFKLIQLVNMVTKIVAGVMLVIMSVVVFGSVMSRYFANLSWAWVEEGAVYLMIWIVALGASLAVSAKHMIAVEAVVMMFSRPLWRVAKTAVIILSVAFLVTLIIVGYNMAALASDQISITLPWLSLFWVYLSIPVGAFMMTLNMIATLIEIWSEAEVKE